MSLPRWRKRGTAATGPSKDRPTLEALHGCVWSTGELGEFVILGFSGSLMAVRRKADGMVGVLTVQTGPPQFFFDFRPDDTRTFGHSGA